MLTDNKLHWILGKLRMYCEVKWRMDIYMYFSQVIMDSPL